MCQPGNPSPQGVGHFSEPVVARGLPQREVGGVALVRVDLELLAVPARSLSSVLPDSLP